VGTPTAAWPPRNGIPRSTGRDYIAEGVKVLARRALPLTDVVRLAAQAGWPYLIVDGVNIPTERVAAQYTKKQHGYSGKHRRHGAAVQTVAAPDGELLWVSGVLPGKTVDITAARRFGIAEKVLEFLGLSAHLGYIGPAGGNQGGQDRCGRGGTTGRRPGPEGRRRSH
jgi:DDE superfamily endonuclease